MRLNYGYCEHLFGDFLQLLTDSVQTVCNVPGVIQRSYRCAHSPAASHSSTYMVSLIVMAAGTTTLTVWATAIDAVIAVTATHLKDGTMH